MPLRCALLLVLVALVASLAAAQPAVAAAPVFGAPQVIAGGGELARAVMGPGGDALVAWSGQTGGLFVSRRAALGGPFSEPVRISAIAAASSLQLARNDRGDIAIAWGGRSPEHPYLVAIAAPGEPFGAPEDVPVPPRGPDALKNIVEDSRSLGSPQLAVGADGTIAVGYADRDAWANLTRTVVSVRPPGGRFGPPQVLLAAEAPSNGVGPSTGEPRLAADGLGRIHAAWIVQPDANPATPPRVVAAEAAPGEPFGAPRVISDPALRVTSHVPQLVANRRGDVVATWNGTGTRIALFPTRVEVVQRSATDDWSAPQLISQPGREAYYPTAAVNDRGDAVVAWFAHMGGTTTSFRPAGGGFGPPAPSVFGGSLPEEIPVALDALGVSVAVRIDGQVRAAVRRRDAPNEGESAISPAAAIASSPAVAMDRFGNGIAVWTTLRSRVGYITTSAYSALPPAIERLRVGSREFRFKASEAAHMRITVRRVHGGRSASQTSDARLGANKLAFAASMRRLLRRGGRYTATIRTRDAGPRTGTTKVRFRRR